MMKKILFGNSISQISKRLAKCFKSLDFPVTRCENDENVMFKMLENDDYDALIFFAACENSKKRTFVKNIRTQYPDVKVYCLFYFNHEHDKINMVNSGASKCFTTGANVNNVCFEILKDLLEEEEDINFSLEIAEFLVELGFPCYLNSFFLVCLSIQRLFKRPDYFLNFSKYLYPFVEAEMNTSYYWAERGIRYISNAVYKNGIFLEDDCPEIYSRKSALENKAFLRVLTKKYEEYTERKVIEEKLK